MVVSSRYCFLFLMHRRDNTLVYVLLWSMVLGVLFLFCESLLGGLVLPTYRAPSAIRPWHTSQLCVATRIERGMLRIISSLHKLLQNSLEKNTFFLKRKYHLFLLIKMTRWRFSYPLKRPLIHKGHDITFSTYVNFCFFKVTFVSS